MTIKLAMNYKKSIAKIGLYITNNDFYLKKMLVVNFTRLSIYFTKLTTYFLLLIANFVRLIIYFTKLITCSMRLINHFTRLIAHFTKLITYFTERIVCSFNSYAKLQRLM